MAFFLLCIYWFVLLIRPQELIASMEQLSLVLYTLFLTFIPFLFSKKNAGSPQLVILLVLLAVIVVSAILNGWSGSIFLVVPEFSAVVVVPFILFSKIIDTSKRQRIIISLSILITLVMVHNGISQKASDIGIGWAGNRLSEGTRITYLGTLADPNDLGMYFVMNVPLAVYCFVRSKALTKLFWLFALIGILYGVFLTNSRGALLGVLSLAGGWWLHQNGIRKTLISSVMLIPLVFVAATKFRTIDAEEESAHGRVEAWYEGFQMLIHHPFFGVGMNRFMEYHHLTAHNSYVLIAAELGLIGFTLWLSFIALSFVMMFQVAFYNKPFIKGFTAPVQDRTLSAEVIEEILLARTFFFSLIGFVVTSFFLSRCYSFVLYIYAGMGIGGYYRSLLIIPELKPITLGQVYIKLILFAAVALVGLYLVVRILN